MISIKSESSGVRTGVETPIPPNAINAAAVEGLCLLHSLAAVPSGALSKISAEIFSSDFVTPRGGSITGCFREKLLAPPCSKFLKNFSISWF